jgi:hypothetical protein
MLPIAVHCNDHFGTRSIHAGRQCCLMPEIAAEAEQGYSRVVVHYFSKRINRPVAGTVIHINKMEFVCKRIDHIANLFVRVFNNSLFIEDGNDKVNGYFFGSHQQDFTMRFCPTPSLLQSPQRLSENLWGLGLPGKMNGRAPEIIFYKEPRRLKHGHIQQADL